jgi:putative flavoprotein involved in K+ transport
MSTVAMPANIETWLNRFTDALRDPSPDYVADLFVDDCYWRDMSAFTWDLRTLEGRDQIRHMVASAQRFLKGSWWKAVSSPLTTEDQAVIEFETELGRGTGVVRLRDGRCWTLLTALSELKGHEEASGLRRHSGSPRGVTDPKVNWQDVRNEEARTLGYSAQPYVLIIGGGQGGLALAARLKHLDVPTLIVDRHARTGDQWRSRYHSLLLHDPIWYDHMPYIPFPDTWPVFTPKDKLADWLEAYAKIMELNIWLSTTFRQASYDEGSQTWRIEVDRDGEAVVLRPKHLVIATGNAGWPIVPEFKGADTFRGKILHSSVFTDAEAHKGRRVAVIGSNNSAQDVCADLARGGVDVTMIQRDPTSIVRSDTVIEVMLKGLYSEEAVAAGLTTDLADLANASTPLRLAPDIYRPMTEAVAQKDADYYARLEATGFMHDFGEDGTGMGLKYLSTRVRLLH